MTNTAQSHTSRQIVWSNLLTVVSAAILIAAEVFGAAFAAGWALSSLFDLGDLGAYILQAVFFIAGIAVIGSFIRAAKRVEPFSVGR